MKLMIASDIHGSAYYCEKMIDAFHREKADIRVTTVIFYITVPEMICRKNISRKKVIEMLNNMKANCSVSERNCDTEVDQMVLEFPILADYAILSLNDRTIFATHGHQFNRDNLPMLKEGDILLNGHFHVPAGERIGKYIYLNPGSISIPKENSEHSYMIIEDNVYLWKNLEGEVYKKEVF